MPHLHPRSEHGLPVAQACSHSCTFVLFIDFFKLFDYLSIEVFKKKTGAGRALLGEGRG